VDEELQRVIGGDAEAIAKLSETELLARLVQGEATQAVRHKTLVLTTLLKEAGDARTANGRADQGRGCYLKALHLLLDVLGQGEVFEYPEFVPRVEMLVSALGDEALPGRTLAMLMQHYERTGEFAKAEEALFNLLDADPDNAVAVEFGQMFCRRLLAQSDEALSAGNLPRAEVESTMQELQERLERLRCAR
jgi:tetratricopeptide (TPR) repeat protein